MIRGAAILLVALLGVLMAPGCSCPDVVRPPSHTVFVEKGQIVKDLDNPGWYRVTEGWLAKRLEYEQRMQRDLTACKEGSE